MMEWVAYRARYSADKEAFVENNRHWTYAEFQVFVAELAKTFQAAGTVRGDRIGLVPKTSVRSAAALFAIQRLGATPVILNFRWSWTEIKQHTEAIQCKAIYTDDFDGRFPTPEVIPLKHRMDLSGPDLFINPIPGREIDLDDPSVILFTSGSSGESHAVELSFGNFFWNNLGTGIRLGSEPRDRWLACLPIFHVGGLAIIIRGILNGLPVNLQDGFNPDDVLDAIENEGITLISLVPTMLHRLLKTGASRLGGSELRAMLIGGGYIHQSLLDQSLEEGLPIALTYGMTETASQIATANPKQVLAKPGSVGQPLFFNRVAILDEAGNALGPNKIGEIILNGPTIMLGYVDTKNDAGRKLKNGTLSTGDLGYHDSDGDLWIVGRKDGVINSGGEKVYPQEIEEALLQHPGVIEAHVFGVEDPEWGQKVSAAVVGMPNNQLYPEDLIEYLRPTLGGYKIPRNIIFLDKFPRTGSGKIDLHAVLAQVEAKNGSK